MEEEEQTEQMQEEEAGAGSPLRTLEDKAAAAESAEEASNTVPEDEDGNPGVIGSYTENVDQEQEAAQDAEQQDAPGEQGDPEPSNAEVAETQGAVETEAVADDGQNEIAVVSRPQSQQAGSRPASRDNIPAEDKVPSRPASQQAAGSRPGSGIGEAQAERPSSRPQSQQGGSRPESRNQEAAEPAASGSRPVSQQGSRPVSQPAEAGAPGSRAGSQTGEAAAAASRQGSQQGSRPASRAQDAPAERPSSRPATGEALVEKPASRAGSTHEQGTSSSRPGSVPQAPPADQRPASRPSSMEAPRPPSNPPKAATPPAPAPAPPAALPKSLSSKAPAAASQYVAAGIKAIDVEVGQGPGLPFRMIRVILDYTQVEAKPYVGGFKNKRSGATYHHAFTQTPREKKYANAEPKLERTTQTVKVSTRSGQTQREAATQMERPGVLVDTTGDRVKTPGRYQTSEERLAIVTAATCTIQRYIRGYFGRKRASYLRQKKMEREAFLREQELKAQREAEEHRRKEIERRMHPRTAADFEILYNELEAWRLQETKRIKDAGLPKEKEQEVLQQLLHKETKLLQTIDRLKINANHENKEVRIQRTLDSMGQPKRVELKNGAKVDVHTPFTTRAKELMQLYNGLNLPMLNVDERLDVLLHVKWTVKEFDCNLTREIVELIDREADLLNRGRAPKMLEGLRKRISGLFLNFIETEEFNPQAATQKIIPMNFEQYLFEKLEKSSARAPLITAAATDKWDL